jgi:enolase
MESNLVFSNMAHRSVFDGDWRRKQELTLSDCAGNSASCLCGDLGPPCAAPEFLKRFSGIRTCDQKGVDEVLLELSSRGEISPAFAAAFSVAAMKLGAAGRDEELHSYLSYGGGPAQYLSALAAAGSARYGRLRLRGDFPRYVFVAYGFARMAEGVNALWRLTRAWERRLSEALHICFEFGCGMFVPPGSVGGDEEILELMRGVIAETGLAASAGIGISLEASSFYDKKSDSYVDMLRPGAMGRSALLALYRDFALRYPLVYMEDPLFHGDVEGFAEIRKETGVQVLSGRFGFPDGKSLYEALSADAIDGVVADLYPPVPVTFLQKRVRAIQDAGLKVFFDGARGGDGDLADISWAWRGDLAMECGLGAGANRCLAVEAEAEWRE